MARRYTLSNHKSITDDDGVILYAILDRTVLTCAYAKASCINNIFSGCTIKGGHFYGGVFRGGTYIGGLFYLGGYFGGLFKSGVFNNGMFHGGEFRCGVFNNGYFHDGTFEGGEFFDGDYTDGAKLYKGRTGELTGEDFVVNVTVPQGFTVRVLNCDDLPVCDILESSIQTISE